MIQFAAQYYDEIKEGSILIGLITEDNEDMSGIIQGCEYPVILSDSGNLCIWVDGDLIAMNPSYAEMFAIKQE